MIHDEVLPSEFSVPLGEGQIRIFGLECYWRVLPRCAVFALHPMRGNFMIQVWLFLQVGRPFLAVFIMRALPFGVYIGGP